MKVIIFGCGGVGIKVKELFESEGICIVAFADNNENKWGTYFQGIRVVSPKQIRDVDFDLVAIGVYKGVESIKQQLLQLGILKEKITIPIEPPSKIYVNPQTYSKEKLLTIPREEYTSKATIGYQKLDIKVDDKEFLNKIENLKRVLYENNIPLEKVCIVSGAVLQAYNLRESTKFDDIDIIMTSDLRKLYGTGLVIVSDSVEMHPQDENDILDDELINNIDNHFIFRDIKFLTLELLYRFKKGKKNTQEEVSIIENYLKR